MRTSAVAVVAVGAILAAGGCEKSAKQDKLAYDACLEAAKNDAKLSGATFAAFEQAKVAGSTGEEELRVNIPYTLGSDNRLFQCIAQKQRDGSYKVVF